MRDICGFMVVQTFYPRAACVIRVNQKASSSDVQRLSTELGLCWTETMEPRTASWSLRRILSSRVGAYYMEHCQACPNHQGSIFGNSLTCFFHPIPFGCLRSPDLRSATSRRGTAEDSRDRQPIEGRIGREGQWHQWPGRKSDGIWDHGTADEWPWVTHRWPTGQPSACVYIYI